MLMGRKKISKMKTGLIALLLSVAVSRAGEYAADFLRIGVGARSAMLAAFDHEAGARRLAEQAGLLDEEPSVMHGMREAHAVMVVR